MPETLNVNVLVAAKEEYTKQIISSLTPIVHNGLLVLYYESQKQNVRRKISYSNFQKSLKKVPEWTSFRLLDEVERTKKDCPFLMDLVTAIFVSHVKILACVRLKGDHKSIKIKIPSIESFLHKLYINICEKMYYKPTIIHDRKEVLYEVISLTIDETIRCQIPIESILQEYLSGVFDEDPEPEKTIQADDIVSDEDSDSCVSDPESEFDPGENKTVPIIPIERPIRRNIPIVPELVIPPKEKDEYEGVPELDSDIDSDDEPEPEQEITSPGVMPPSDPVVPSEDVTLFDDI